MQALRLITIASLLLLVACSANYTTPASGVNLVGINDSQIAELMAREPFAQFPARIAIIRLQANNYSTLSNTSYGHGNYIVVTSKDIEPEDSIERISQWEAVTSIAPIGRLLLSDELQNMQQIRQAAAHLKADLVFAYTIDTDFHVANEPISAMGVISLGYLQKNKAFITSTVSGMIVDVRSGYVYGVSEGTAKMDRRSSIWNTESTIDNARLKTERQSFETFVTESEKLWQNIVNQYAN